MDIIWIFASVLIGYVLVYSLVERICKCVEHCAEMKSVGHAMSGMKNNELLELINKFNRDQMAR